MMEVNSSHSHWIEELLPGSSLPLFLTIPTSVCIQQKRMPQKTVNMHFGYVYVCSRCIQQSCCTLGWWWMTDVHIPVTDERRRDPIFSLLLFHSSAFLLQHTELYTTPGSRVGSSPYSTLLVVKDFMTASRHRIESWWWKMHIVRQLRINHHHQSNNLWMYHMHLDRYIYAGRQSYMQLYDARCWFERTWHDKSASADAWLSAH